jgi:hypothetical protein
MGCGIGCLVLIVLVVIAGGAFWMKVGSPMVKNIKRMEQVQGEIKKARADVVALETSYATGRFRQPDTVELAAVDLDKYIRIRKALQPHLEAAAQAEETAVSRFDFEGSEPPGMGEMMGMAFGTIGGLVEVSDAHLNLLKESWAVLYPESMAPSDMADLAALIEWRFLGREEAMALSLPPEECKQLVDMRKYLRMNEGFLNLSQRSGGQVKVSGQDTAELERSVERMRENVAALEERARSATSLSAQTRVLLESRRYELEALGTEGIEFLGLLTQEFSPPVPGGPHGGPNIQVEHTPGG